MTYVKPSHLKYTDLAIYFDNNFYTPNRNDDLLYQYVYLLVYMLACKKRYFLKYDDYDKFALFAATTLYMRFIQKERRGERIKSVLNYIKSVLYSLKVMFQYETFHEVMNPETSAFDSDKYKKELSETIQQDYDYKIIESVQDSLDYINDTIWEIITDSPYKKDNLLCKRLYMSCLLSFINSITFKNIHKPKLPKMKDKMKIKLLKKEQQDFVLLWHLTDEWKDYVLFLMNKIKQTIFQEFRDIEDMYNLSEDTIDGILASAYNTYDEDQEDLAGKGVDY